MYGATNLNGAGSRRNTDEEGKGLPKITEGLHHKQPRNSAERQSFSCIQDILSHYERNAPDRPAILARGRPPMTFGGLWIQANDVVRMLRGIGLGRSDRIAVVLPGGPEAAVAMITVAAGAVCVPLNPGFTYDEYQRYFGELRLAALLTTLDLNSASRRAAQTLDIPVVELSPRLHYPAGTFSIASPAPRPAIEHEFASSTDDAYLLLTSGSTSWPKTVPLTHASVCLSASNVCDALALESRDRLLSVLPLYHGHGLISGVLTALTSGSSVVCMSAFDVTAFFGCLTEFRPTWYTAVPAIHRALLSAPAAVRKDARASSLRLVRSASTSLAPEALDKLETLFGVPVIDTYGMTEAATQIAANPLERRKSGSVGQAAGPEIAILDSEGRRLPSGKRGEIALRGPTITRGYDNDFAATASAFRDGWFLTGDLGYLDAEGYLFIVGRIKEIIHKGAQKIAPAEVEATLLSHPSVSEAAVFAVPHARLGADVAAAIVLRQDAKVDAQDIRDFARERLAGFKVPGVVRIVPEIPKGGGGKIKRNELAAAFSKIPPTTAGQGGKTISSCSELESQLAEIWVDILQIDRIGVDRDVFALGVDSLTMMQMILRLEERFGVSFSFEDIFRAPTVAALALRLESSKGPAKGTADVSSGSTEPMEIAHVKGDGAQPLSSVQERMLRIERELPGLPQFNLPFGYRLRGSLNVQALEQSFAEVVRRHGSLRTEFAWQDEFPVALVMPRLNVKSFLVVKDLATQTSGRSGRARKLLLIRAALEAEQECLEPIAMDRAPLFRAYLFRLDAKDHVMLLVVHDSIIDGWSMAIFMEELSELYAASIEDRKAELTEPALQFSDFARWQRRWSTRGEANRQFAYWRRRLDAALPPFTAPKSNVGGELISRVAQQRFQISDDLMAQLNVLSRSRGVTRFMSLLAGFKTLLLLKSGRNDICVATSMANRCRPRTERVIGPFANTTLIRTQLDADLTFGEALLRVREAVLEAYARQELPFDTIVTRLAEETGLHSASLVQVYFALQAAFRRSLKLPGVTASSFDYQEGRSAMPIDRAWLSITLKETPTGITGICGHKTDLFAPDTVEHWTADYTAILAKAAAAPDTQLGRLTEL
jgi:acyl-CoA synthetase (AMP-forming)/AMP-acid ligase II/acyl carrier protein